VVGSACVAVMTPGLLLAVESRREGVELWVARAFALSLVGVSIAAPLAQGGLRMPVTGRGVLALLAGIAGPCGLWGARERRRGRSGLPPAPAGTVGVVVLTVLVPLGLFIGLLPKFLWESFNGDGAHAFESARLAAHQFLPFWDRAAGDIASFPGMSTVL